MSETCKHPDTSFDRTLCPAPCNMMHNYCTECGECGDPCPHKATPSSGVTDGKAESGERWYPELDEDALYVARKWVERGGLSWDADAARAYINAYLAAVTAGSVAAQPPAPAAEQKARVLRDLVAWRGGFHAIETARGSGRFTAVREALTELELIVDRADAALATPATEGKAENGYPFMTVQDAIETAILARGVDVPDLADVVFVAAEAVQALWAAPQSPAPADDAATVLAGLREEMTAVCADVVEAMQFGLSGIDPYCGRPDDEERWMKRLAEWADWIHGEYVKPIEAAQQRLADRGQSGGSDG